MHKNKNGYLTQLNKKRISALRICVEGQYGVEGYVQILQQEVKLLRDLISKVKLDRVAIAKAKKLIFTPVRITLKGRRKNEIPWHLKYQPSTIEIRKQNKNQKSIRNILWGLMRFIYIRNIFHLGSKFFFINSAERHTWLCWPWDKEVRKLQVGFAMPGMRVPMNSQYSCPSDVVGAALVVDNESREIFDAVSDYKFKTNAGKILFLDKKGLKPFEPAATRKSFYVATNKTSELPKISLVIVSYNQREFLNECIESVLDQKYKNRELIIVDGASKDGSGAIIKKHRKYFDYIITEPDRGQSHALNKGFSVASGRVLGWLCSDDRLEKNAFTTVGSIYSKTRSDIIAGGCRIIDRLGNTKYVHYSGFITEKTSPLSFGDCAAFNAAWQKSLYFFQPEVFFSRNIWKKSGGFIREELYYAMDYELILRFALAGATVFATRELIGCSRQHQSQKTRQDVPNYLPTVKCILEHYLDIFKSSESRDRRTCPSRLKRKK